jgi:nucleotidyltransferase/DNA polymerase involved in DNA repair
MNEVRMPQPRETGRQSETSPGGDGRTLSDLDSVGPATLRDFRVLGISSVSQLARCDGRALYERLCGLTGTRHDRCCEDVLVAAIAQARDPNLPVEQRRWWYWSRVRKRRER